MAYLSDRDIKKLLPEINLDTGDTDRPFSEDQIQPCSIDLRLDRVFWRQRRGGALDLRNAQLMEVEPRRHWQKRILKPAQGITIKPGQMVLGRTFESFTIPSGYAGKLEGRSSFARMGLSIHCSGDFINPGYRGHMPLQMINHGVSSVVVFPYISICQLIFNALTSTSERLYGHPGLESKYMDDDGGPSYWWRDKWIRRLQQALGARAVNERTQREILDFVGPCETELIDRFEQLVRRLPVADLTNAHEMLDRFAASEDRARRWAIAWRSILKWAGPALLTTSIGVLFKEPYGKLHYTIWALASLALLGNAGWFFFAPPLRQYLGTGELEQKRRESGSN